MTGQEVVVFMDLMCSGDNLSTLYNILKQKNKQTYRMVIAASVSQITPLTSNLEDFSFKGPTNQAPGRTEMS